MVIDICIPFKCTHMVKVITAVDFKSLNTHKKVLYNFI